MSGDGNKENKSSSSGSGRVLGGGNGTSEPLPESWTRPTTQPRVGRIGAWGRSTGSNSSDGRRIAGIHDLPSTPSMRPGGHDQGDSDEDQQPQSFFAGGERSGISVEGPSRSGGNNLVRDILKKAEHGGPAAGTNVQAHGSGTFAGGGHTLGSDDVPSQYIGVPEDPESTEAQETAVRNITFWREGFSVEDGPLLRYDVPENAKLLAEINDGQAPPSILNVREGQPVDLQVAKRTDEDYIPPPKRPLEAFEGGGQRLGSPVPTATGVESSMLAIPGSFPTSEATQTTHTNRSQFEVNQNEPTTSVQVRLEDGTRLVARMNLTHTVGDIRNFINASRPGYSSRSYTIGTTFPNRTLDDDTASLDTAGLKNCVVVQRII